MDEPVSDLNVKDFYPDVDFENFKGNTLPLLLKKGSLSSETRLKNLKTGEIIEVSKYPLI